MANLDRQGAQQVSCAFEIDVAHMHDQIHGTATAALEPGIEELGAAQQQFELPSFNIDVIALGAVRAQWLKRVVGLYVAP